MITITFKSVSFRNFMSYGNNMTVFGLDSPGTMLICGENLDDTSDGSSSNGSGKTALINAISYGAYDRPISKISKDGLVNNINKKNMEVVLEFTNGLHTYVVKRSRKQKYGAAGNTVHLWEDGKDITLDRVDRTNDLIEKILGVPYELFVRIVVFSANHQPFLDLPVRHPTSPCQTAIIEELFNLTTLTEKSTALNKMIKDTDVNITLFKTQIESLEREHARHRKQLDNAENRVKSWQENNENQIKQLQSKLASIQNIDLEREHANHILKERLTQKINDVVEAQQTLDDTIKKQTERLKKLKSQLDHLHDAKCPYCLQQYADNIEKITETKEQILLTEEIIGSSADELSSIADSLRQLVGEFKIVDQTLSVNNIDELMEIKNQGSKYTEKITELTKTINPFKEPLEELQQAQLEPIKYDELNEAIRLNEHQRFLQKLLSKKDSFVRKALLNKNIPFLNNRLNAALDNLGLPHMVEFDHEMVVNISQLGRTLDFGNLSGGQQARVNIALSFAFRDVLESMHTRFNICVLDEALDVGLDDIGMQMAAKFLKKKARDEQISLFIISHRNETRGIFDRIITIQLEKGFSSIKSE